MPTGVHGDYITLRSCNDVCKEFIGGPVTGSYPEYYRGLL